MPASEETGSGPVIHDHRRIDPVTGQVRGRHAASKLAGTTSAGRPASGSGPAGSQAAPAGDEPAGGQEEADVADTTEEVLEGKLEDQAPAAAGQKQTSAEQQLAERTADLQRLQAEYANYRKRVDRDRVAVKEQAVATVLAGLLPVLDAIGQAREHGELSGGFK